MNNALITSYQELIAQNKITHDPAQDDIATKLSDLQRQLKQYGTDNKSILGRIFGNKAEKPKGLYIWGGVGRGKSMLMDLFFDSLNMQKKRRVHFHAFMIEVHKELFTWRKENKNNSKDPLPNIAQKVANETTLLCFDEFQVTDIADAMIIGRLFENLFANGVIMVATSNRIPDDLYKDGLQRSSFTPFIKLLKENTQVLELSAKQDYRLSHLKALSTVYYTPINKNSEKFLKDAFAELTNNAKPVSTTLDINGRTLTLNKTHSDIAWLDFNLICGEALGAADYIEIATEFSTVLMSSIPVLTAEYRNEAKRFVTFIDALYEHNVKFICTAENEPNELYNKGDGSFEFERTVSRLIEMQSDKYLQGEHIA